jgi:flagellar hook assembly protein FlgD
MNKTSDVTLKIYDAAGGLVKTINCGVRIKGHHQIQINVADLIPGTYSIVLENGTGKTVSPLTIQ